MPVQVDVDGPGWRILAIAAWSILASVFAWVANGLRAEQKAHGERIDKLERTYVTRDELDKHVARLEAASQRMHSDNQAALIRIEEKIERGSQTRHDIRDGVGAIQLMLKAALQKNQHSD